MAQNTTVSLTLQIKGNAGAELKKISDQQVQSTTKLNQQWTQIGNAQAKFVNTAKAGTQATINTARAGDQVLRTNRMIEGVLRQQSIQTKLQSQLLKQQVSSTQQMASWMKQVEQSSRRTQQSTKETSSNMSRLQKMGAVAGGITGGYMAAKAVAATPLERGRNFYKGIYEAGASITSGFKGMSPQEAKTSREELKTYAKDAVRTGHGTLEGVAEAANILAASGNYEKVSDLKAPLVAIAKSAFAAGAGEEDMAKLAGQAKQFGIPLNRTQAALDRMMQSGYAGGFELKDMSQFLPKILGVATKAGYAGESGLNTVTTHLQLARKYTGTPGEAATNIEDLYNLETQGHFKKALGKYITREAGDPTMVDSKGNTRFDFNKYLVNNQLKGVDTITAMANLMNRQLSKNKDYNDLNKKLADAVEKKDTKQVENIKKAIEIVIAGTFGDVFHNQQSLSGMTAIVNGVKNGDYQKIYNESWSGEGSVDRVFKDKSGEEFAQYDALQQENILAQIKMYDTVNGKLGEFEKGLTQIMQNNQGLAAATIAATGALTVLASTAGGSVLGGVLGGGKSNGIPPATGGVGTSTATGGNRLSKLAKGAGAAGLVYGGYEVFKPIDDALYSKISKLMGFSGERPDFMKMYMEKNAEQRAAQEQQNNQLIAEQQAQTQLASQLLQAFSTLSSTIANNRPVINFPSNSPFGQSVNKEEKRHGAAVPWSLAAK